jgi:anti-sigma-K factor RskA
MSEECRQYREDIGAYVLNSLDPERAAALGAHLDGCPSCRAEAAELQSVARALPAADPLRTDRPQPPAHLGDQIVRRVAIERRVAARRRWRRLGTALAAAAVIVAALLVGPGLLRADRPTQWVSAFEKSPAGASATAFLEYFPSGTRVELTAQGLPSEQQYSLWMETDDGERIPGGTFWVPESGEIEVTLTAAIDLKKCAAVGVSNADGDTVMWSPVNWERSDAVGPLSSTLGAAST